MKILILLLFFVFLSCSKATTELLLYSNESNILARKNLDFPEATSFNLQISIKKNKIM